MELKDIEEFLGETSEHEIWDYVELLDYYEQVWI
jgi:hypothetical protein